MQRHRREILIEIRYILRLSSVGCLLKVSYALMHIVYEEKRTKRET